ncbi:TetR/AcrR family transcriptional regulator [Streptomyces sp. NBC_00083]|uniref:TetR/AcrR family transcriptional regulator n=1 Tax=Streptomyces sp. NBC_00083 TaxID=2975647 RepID=UPI00225199E0|nr:TetR/AcrR family transcriptional regulator [Streptomyces sp. NBC_00083]MCX5388019.1 TetR/AcrR family transcriptional regulator [Streptomyces sp. NBC_00083]
MSDETSVALVATSRRERNKQRMRERIFSAALSLFAEKGFEQTTIDDITERADVARGTFFNHFQHKEELISTWSNQRRELLEDKLRQEVLAEADVSKALGRCMAALVGINGEEAAELNQIMLMCWVRAGLPITEHPYTAEVFADVIRTGIASGQIRAGTEPTQVGHLLRDAYLGALFRLCRNDLKRVDLGVELQRVLDLVLPSILTKSPGRPA